MNHYLKIKRNNKLESILNLKKEVSEFIKYKETPVISFDIFDTLLHRRIAPNYIVEAICSHVNEVYLGGLSSTSEVMQKRDEAYLEISQLNAERGLDFDACSTSFFKLWLEKLGIDPSFALSVEAAEVEKEILCSYPDPEIMAWIKELKEQSIDLICTSDMYLSKRSIIRILKALGYSPLWFTNIFVSCEEGYLKRTGKLFQHIASSMKIPANNFFHIGDSSESDYIQAKKAGWNACQYLSSFERKEIRLQKFDLEHLQQDKYWSGVVLSQFCKHRDLEGNAAEEYGRNYLGPIYSIFLHKVYERCLEEGISKVYFLAREGYVLHDIFEYISSALCKEKKQITPIYLGVSRLSSMRASLTRISLRELTMFQANTREMTIKSLFAPLGIPQNQLEKICEQSECIGSEEILPPNYISWPPFQRFLDLLNKSVKPDTEQNSLFIEYLRGLGFFNEDKVAIVDVGWGGQIQDNIYRAISKEKKVPQVFGFYLGVNISAHQRKSKNNWMEGLLCDSETTHWFSRSFLEFVQGVETFVRAPHPTVIGYERNDFGLVEPRLKEEKTPSRQQEEKQDLILTAFQNGMRKFARLYSDFLKIRKVESKYLIPFANMLSDRVIRYPQTQEAKWITSFSNVSDLGSDFTVTLASQSNENNRFDLSDLKKSIWKYGYLSSGGKRFLAPVLSGYKAKSSYPPLGYQLMGGVVVKEPDPTKLNSSILFDNGLQGRNGLYLHARREHLKLTEDLRDFIFPCGHIDSFPLDKEGLLLSRIGFELAKISTRLYGHHRPTYDGLSLKELIKRSLLK